MVRLYRGPRCLVWQVFVAAQGTDERQETSRRSLLAASLLASLVLEGSLTRPAVAVQGLTAGRLPGDKPPQSPLSSSSAVLLNSGA